MAGSANIYDLKIKFNFVHLERSSVVARCVRVTQLARVTNVTQTKLKY